MALPDPKRSAAQNMIKRSGSDPMPFLKALLDVGGMALGAANAPVAAAAKVGEKLVKAGTKAVTSDKKAPEEEKEWPRYDPATPMPLVPYPFAPEQPQLPMPEYDFGAIEELKPLRKQYGAEEQDGLRAKYHANRAASEAREDRLRQERLKKAKTRNVTTGRTGGSKE